MSVSCVEDGVSQPSTRLQLGYGGSDVAQLLGQLLARAGGRHLDQLDQLQLLGMKEAVCHLELDRSGVVTFQGRHLGDECLGGKQSCLELRQRAVSIIYILLASCAAGPVPARAAGGDRAQGGGGGGQRPGGRRGSTRSPLPAGHQVRFLDAGASLGLVF